MFPQCKEIMSLCPICVEFLLGHSTRSLYYIDSFCWVLKQLCAGTILVMFLTISPLQSMWINFLWLLKTSSSHLMLCISEQRSWMNCSRPLCCLPGLCLSLVSAMCTGISSVKGNRWYFLMPSSKVCSHNDIEYFCLVLIYSVSKQVNKYMCVVKKKLNR